MVIEETVTVNGMPMDVVDAGPRPAPERYVVVEKGRALEVVMYDGSAPFAPRRGALVREAEWKGPAPEPEVPADVRARRTREERLDAMFDRLDEDIKGWDAMGAPARAAATLRAMRLLRQVVRAMRDDLTED